MKLYTYDPAPNPRRLKLFMEYKGLALDTQQVDLMNREQLGEAYRRINPECTVPALQLDDGAVLTEVIGICTYLEELHPEPPLLGRGARERAEVISWVHKLANTLLGAVTEAFRNATPGFKGRALPGSLDLPQIPALAERGRVRLAHAWRTLEADLEGRPWLAGERPSLADIDLLVGCEFARWIKESVPAECGNLQAFLARAKETFPG